MNDAADKSAQKVASWYDDEETERRVSAVFSRRGGYAEDEAKRVSRVLVVAAKHGAGDALATLLLSKWDEAQLRKLWDLLTGSQGEAPPAPFPIPRRVFAMFEWDTGDAEMNAVLKRLDHYSVTGGRWPKPEQ